ncbi:MAG: hypothetical protein DRP71_16015 [Verrucomicrobia bacterium]|nr:MAG: hypothetical protein DRP71_16015 [Verrucomicrobiota bacterium]
MLTAAVDVAWLRPKQARLAELTLARDQAQRDLIAADRSGDMATAYLGYVEAKEEPEADWLAAYQAMDPFTVLEHYRRMSGLSRKDMDLDERTDGEALNRARYFLSLTGTHEQALRYLQSLELAPPLIEVDSFVLESQPSRKVSLRLHVSVLLPTGASS